MRQLSPSGQQAVNEIAKRHGFSFDATLAMLDAVVNGNGNMAQFNHPEFSGSGQWMRGGMTMVSDMFNNHLKGRVDALCSELSNLVASQPDLVRSGSFQSQSQGGGAQQQSWGSSSDSTHSRGFGQASLFVPPPAGTSGGWWPSELRSPSSTGSQNGVRYAYFPDVNRLAIDVGGNVTVYDTLDHRIGGFSQQQSYGGTLSFTSQYGLIDVASLPVVSSTPDARAHAAPSQRNQPASASASSAPSASSGPAGGDVFAAIEKLADLRARGILTDEEFAAKKAELLNRV